MGFLRFASVACVAALMPMAALADITQDERLQVRELETQYQSCLGAQLFLMIDGSDDVALIVKTALGQCSRHLPIIQEKLLSFGVSPGFALGWLEQSGEETRSAFTAFALQKKAERKRELAAAPASQ